MRTNKWFKIIAALSLTIWCFVAQAAINAASESYTHDFNDTTAGSENPEWIDRVDRIGGTISGNPKNWHIPETDPENSGQLLIHLNPQKLPADLSLTLFYEELEKSEFIIQLLDASGFILVPDMFSGIVRTGQDTRSDTYIINFIRHHAAKTIVIKRVKGPLTLYGFTLMSVVCELPAVIDGDRENCLASELIDDEDFNVKVSEASERITGHVPEWTRELLLSQQEPQESLSRKLMLAYELPEYVPGEDVSGTVEIPVTATCIAPLYNMGVALEQWHPSLSVECVQTDTPGAEEDFMDGIARMAVVSDPMSLAFREDYFKKHGQSPIDIPVAMGALQILVNKNNPLTHITLLELERIYAESGHSAAVATWNSLSGVESYEGNLVAYGGYPTWGTSRAFARLAMQGKSFNKNIATASVIHSDGIQRRVAVDPGGIGFISAAPQALDVRVVPVAVSSGRDAYLPNAANIYSGAYPLTRRFYINIGADDAQSLAPAERELLNFILSKQGQTEVAKSGLLPLTLEQLVHARNALKLD